MHANTLTPGLADTHRDLFLQCNFAAADYAEAAHADAGQTSLYPTPLDTHANMQPRPNTLVPRGRRPAVAPWQPTTLARTRAYTRTVVTSRSRSAWRRMAAALRPCIRESKQRLARVSAASQGSQNVGSRRGGASHAVLLRSYPARQKQSPRCDGSQTTRTCAACV
jgi:hypothetical protein